MVVQDENNMAMDYRDMDESYGVADADNGINLNRENGN